MMRTIFAVLALASATPAFAQNAPPAPSSARAAAPTDFTGYWVAVVTEDWRWRMMTPPKGDVSSLPVTAEGRKAAESWDPAKDIAAGEQCRAYGAAGIMRMPVRLHVTWQDENTLKIDIDNGTQTRLLHFGDAQPPGDRSLQGYSAASWEFAGGGGARGGRGGGRGGPRFGNLKVVTTHLRPGWLRKNGVPYSENSIVTEFYDRFRSTNGEEWFFVTTAVNDPKFLQQEFVTSSHFKKEADGSKWAPSACKTT